MLTITKPTNKRQGRSIVWEALCNCGNRTFVVPGRAKKGKVKSCGCLLTQRIDWTGLKFGHLTMVKPSKTVKGGNIVWYADCDCGNRVTVIPSKAKVGHVGSCGCQKYIRKRMGPRKDWTGIKLHKLTFIKVAGLLKGGGRGYKWKALCECGNTTTVIPCNVVRGQTTSCGCVADEVRAKFVQSPNKILFVSQYSPIMRSARSVWKSTYGDCEFELFYELSQKPCHYCGIEPHRVYNILFSKKEKPIDLANEEGTFTYNGLDRLDSNLGHVIGNIVPCCWTHNRMKSDLTELEFLTEIERIYKWRILQNSSST